jgi:tetratricopeptide (TPR) repeat protein
VQGTEISGVYQESRILFTKPRNPLRRFRLPLLLLSAAGVFAAGFPAASLSQTSDRDTKVRLAQSLEQSGEFERAAALYQDLLKGDPMNYVLFDGLQRTWMQLKRYDDVILLVRVRLQSSPGDLNLHALLGSVLYRAGREQEAAAAWDTAIAVDPKNPGTYRLVAAVLTENRLLDRAAEMYRRARTTTGDRNLFTLELAQLLSVGMDYAGATTELLHWLQLNPTQLAFIQGRIASWSSREQARAAAMQVIRARLAEHEETPLLELLAWLAMEGKEFGTALETYRRIDDLTHAHGGSLYQFADRAFKERAFAVASQAYQEAIAAPLAPQRLPSAEYGYACALKELGTLADTIATPVRAMPATEAHPLYGGAIARFRRIIDEYPGTEYSAKSWYQIGCIQFEKFADLDGALASFDHVLAETQGVAVLRYDVLLLMGRVDVARGDTARAAGHFSIVAAAPDALPDQTDEANFRLAEIEYFAGRIDKAIATLDGIAVNLKADYANDALRLRAFLAENVKTAPEALRAVARGEFLARQGKNSEAIAVLRDAVAASPQASLVDDALMLIGSLQASSGLVSDAIATYERLLHDFTKSSIDLDRAQFRLGELYQFGTRDTARAIAAYEKLLSDYPGSVLAAQARKRIRQLRGDSF